MKESEYKIGDVVKINIEGTVISCIILSDFMEVYEISDKINYLNDYSWKGFENENENEYVIDTYKSIYSSFHINSCYQVLIGDQKVCVCRDEICL